MTDREKILFKRGLPRRFMGAKQNEHTYMDYSIGVENAKHVTAIKQQRWVRDFMTNISRHESGGIIGLYSTPTDTAAFRCGGMLFEAAFDKGLTCLCVSMEQIQQNLASVGCHDFYLIYGLTDTPVPLLDRSLKSFLYERSGSLRVVVMSGEPTNNAPWNIMHNQLRIKPNLTLVLNDTDDHNQGAIEFIG
jgi:hypothetical protein